MDLVAPRRRQPRQRAAARTGQRHVNPPRRSSPLLHFIALAAIFLVMLGWSWMGWNDPLVDFGRELYVPWQLSSGQALYRDIAYFNGPLSPYFNALLFTCFGAGLRTIAFTNILILAMMIGLIWTILRDAADEWTATVGSAVVLLLFSFLQLGDIGNYNFITPYSHEITHGVFLSFAMLACMSQARPGTPRQRIWIGAAGLLLGLVFLTKIEVFLAAGAAAAVWVALSMKRSGMRGGDVVIVAAAMLLPLLVAWSLLALAMPPGEALAGIFGSWRYALDGRISGLLFYRQTLGIAAPSDSASKILIATLVYALVAGAAAVASMTLKPQPRQIAIVLIIGVGIAAIAFFALPLSVWQQSLRGLTLLAPGVAIVWIVAAWRDASDRLLLRAALASFAAVLLAKIFFNVGLSHYAFALAMPATLVAIVAGWDALPDSLQRRGHSGALARAIVAPAILLLLAPPLWVFGTVYAAKADRVGGRLDQFRADPVATGDPRGRAVNVILRELSGLPRDATLAVLPEGVMLNYLSRRENPTPYISFMPPEVLMFGAPKMLAALKAHPPDYMVINGYSDSREYGFASLDAYAGQIMAWVRENYVDVPLSAGSDFPLKLMKRKPSP
jgi:hypothetical protein